MNAAKSVPFVLALASLLPLTATAPAQTTHQLPSLGDMVMAADHKTLVVSVPSAAQLVYYDTLTDKELKKVDVEFQPSFLAAQGKKLFVATKGAATVHVLDLESGKELKVIKLAGAPIESLACHPDKGLVYASNGNLDVYSIDPATGKATRTRAKGQKLAVDPVDARAVYTGTSNPAKNVAIVQELPGKVLKIQMVKGTVRCLLLKFTPNGADLKCVAANDNAGSGAAQFSIRRDGQAIAMAGPYRVPGKGISHSIAVFDTSDLTTLKGQLEGRTFPRAICFHPQLDLVAVLRGPIRGDIEVYSAKSFVKKESFKLPELTMFPYTMVFGGNGTKLISARGVRQPGVREVKMALDFIPLTLTAPQRETLKTSRRD